MLDRDRGARVLCGGSRHERGGLFFQPTVLADVTPGMVITREETFGPIAPLIRFEDEADVIRMANDTASPACASQRPSARQIVAAIRSCSR